MKDSFWHRPRQWGFYARPLSDAQLLLGLIVPTVALNECVRPAGGLIAAGWWMGILTLVAWMDDNP